MKNEKLVVNTSESSEIVTLNEEKKGKSILKNIGVFLLLLLGYLFIPEVIGLIFYKGFKLSETVSMFIGNISYIVILVAIYYDMFKDKLKDYWSNKSEYLKKALKCWGLGLLVMFVSNIILSYVIFPGEIATNEEVNRIYIKASPIIGFLSIAILAPFVEEMIFRFGLKRVTGNSKYFPIVSAIVFGLPHALTGISSVLELLYVIPYGALGYAFGYVYKETDNIFTSMTVHALHNLLCFVVIMSFA